ncbi:F-box protein At3g07870-like [Cornus florida]|uniref:F-box protein At3g07870-like n=1 Tax=Cornus florida TaxID=4283 RepID=UPI0028A1AEDA|nr:F-box protein At3g07870-like [Cornus florida]
MSDLLPRELWIVILTRLPVKTVVRCAFTCKSWYSLITNPKFIAAHLNQSSLANNNLLLIRSYSGDERYSLVRCENEMFIDYAEFEPPLKIHRNPYLRIIGSCNGLVCISNDLEDYTEELYLWNPSIHKTMALPPLRVTAESHGRYIHTIQFGFDSLTDDYKVVRIAYLDGPDGFEPPPAPEIDIFSLSTGTWRNISHLGLPYAIDERAPQAFLNGAAHWLAFDRRRDDFFCLIVSFHMGDEIFREIMVPASNFRVHGVVAKFQESLSLIDVLGTDSYSIWVMKEYGISNSWTKLFNIDTRGGLLYWIAGFTRNGHVLFATKFGYLVAYDPEVKQVTHHRIRGPIIPTYSDSFYADTYTESLVFFRSKLHDRITCKESLILPGEASGAKKTKEERNEEDCDQGGNQNEENCSKSRSDIDCDHGGKSK